MAEQKGRFLLAETRDADKLTVHVNEYIKE